MISFAAPWVLVGLAAALVPILLHLFARREPPTVEFPAVRYLSETARVHQRRLNLQHWLLLFARTLLIILLVLAAAGPTSPRGGAGTHAPTAMVLILDNSLSSGVTAGGVTALDGLKRAAGAIFDRATPDDRLWLITTDGIAHRGSREVLKRIATPSRPRAPARSRRDGGARPRRARGRGTAGRGDGGERSPGIGADAGARQRCHHRRRGARTRRSSTRVCRRSKPARSRGLPTAAP